VGPNLQQQIESIVNAAYADLVNARLITILSVTPTKIPTQDGAFALVSYRDNTTNLEHRQPL
jgi:hypothetical protein